MTVLAGMTEIAGGLLATKTMVPVGTVGSMSAESAVLHRERSGHVCSCRYSP